VNDDDDDDPSESRTISFFVRVRSGSEISIWHRRRAGGRKGIRRACAPGRYVWRAVGEDNVRAAAAAAAGVNTPPTETAATTDDDDDDDDDDDALGRRRRSHSDAGVVLSPLCRAHARPRDK